MKPKLSLVTLGVADVGRSRAFYEALGFAAVSPDSDDVVFFELGGVVLGLYGRASLAADAGLDPDGSGFAGVTLAHNEPSVADADRAFGEFVAAGATVVKTMEPTDWGGYSGYVADLDGHLWEIAHNPHMDWT
jgi:catechol 2,3-dioxygenase-like lactoylglutathione lyase family enzyme